MTASRGLAIIIVSFVVLSWSNYAWYSHRLETLGLPLSKAIGTDASGAGGAHLSEADIERLKQNLGLKSTVGDMRREFDWMFGREVVLVALALGGIWWQYFASRRPGRPQRVVA